MYHLFGPIFVLVLFQNSLYMVFVTLHMKMTSWQSGIFFGRIGIRWNILLWRPHQVPTVHSPYPPLSSSQAASSSSTRVAEVVRGHGGPPSKSMDSDENFKPEHTLFCRELRFVAIYAFFGDLWAKKVPFWVKNSVSWVRSALLLGIY